MNVQKGIFRSAETIAMAIAPCLVAGAQVTSGDGHNPYGDNLADDVVPAVPIGGQGSAYDGPVLEGGAVFVDLGSDAPLVLNVEGIARIDSGPRGIRPPRERKKLRLAGGTPGNAGAILVDLEAPAAGAGGHLSGAAVISGTFGMDGSIVVELPEIEQEVFVQGIEHTPIGNQLSDIGRLLPGGTLADADAPAWDAQPIPDAVRGATAGDGRALVSLRFFGAARMAGLQRSVDTTVVLGRDPSHADGFVLSLSAALAQRTALVDLADGSGATLRFRSAEELSGAVEAVILLDAFADVDEELAAARTRHADLRAGPGGAIGRCGTPDRSLDTRPNGASAYDGPIDDAGGVDVLLSAVGASWDVLMPIDAPRRAGDRRSLFERRAVGGSEFSGPIGDAGGVTVQLPQEDAITVSFERVGEIAPPQRAGARQPLPTGDGGAARRAVESLASAERTLATLRRGLGPAVQPKR